jgi:hypothetical protein
MLSRDCFPGVMPGNWFGVVLSFATAMREGISAAKCIGVSIRCGSRWTREVQWGNGNQ